MSLLDEEEVFLVSLVEVGEPVSEAEYPLLEAAGHSRLDASVDAHTQAHEGVCPFVATNVYKRPPAGRLSRRLTNWRTPGTAMANRQSRPIRDRRASSG